MPVKVKRGWELPESAGAPEHVFRDRRRLIRGLAAGPILLAIGGVSRVRPGRAAADPSAALYPAPRNPRYELDRPLTAEELATGYNNFYEFGSSKDVVRAAQRLPVRPWTVTIDGMVEQPMTLAIDDLIARLPLEERL